MDYWIFIPVLLLTLIGLYVMSHVLQAGYGSGVWPSNFMKQLGAAMVGILIALFVALMDGPSLRLLAGLVYGISLLLLIYVKIDHFYLQGPGGADSWIRLPLIGTFQPSELAKVGIAMMAAGYFAQMKEGSISYLRGMTAIFFIYALPLFLIYREPDFGTAFVIIMMFFTTLFIWGISWRYILGAVALMAAAIPLLWFFYFSPYQKDRILPLLFPGLTDNYNVDQAMKAIAAGGLSGSRTGVDVPVPVKESDFIFSAVGEKLGFIGTSLVIFCVAVFLFRLLYICWKLTEVEPEYAYLLAALFANLSFHFVENIGMNVGLLPVTGIPLPFISNGGTSMIVNYFALGLILSASMDLKARSS